MLDHIKLGGTSETFRPEEAPGKVWFPGEEAFCLVINAAELVD